MDNATLPAIIRSLSAAQTRLLARVDAVYSSPPPSPDDQTRLYLALMVCALFIVLALATVVEPTASAVLDKVIPVVTMVLGYFFGREVQRTRS